MSKIADRAESMVEGEVARFLEAYRGRRIGPTITALRTHVLGVARAEVERLWGGPAPAGERERERQAMFALADAIAKKLLHTPQVVLKKGGADPVDGAALVASVQRLFDLQVPEPGAEADEATETASAQAQAPDKAAGR